MFAEHPYQMQPPSDNRVMCRVTLPATKANGQLATKDQTLWLATAPVVGGVSLIDGLSPAEVQASAAVKVSHVFGPEAAGQTLEADDLPVVSAEAGDQRIVMWVENDE